MALLSRNSLLTNQTFQKFPSHCYLCYVCPDDCYTRSPPSLPPPAPSNGHHLSTFLILMLCLLGLASLILSYMTIRRYRCNSRRSESLTGLENGEFLQDPGLNDHQHPAWFIRTVGLPQAVIESIPVFRFGKYGSVIEGKGCSVCLSEFRDEERIRVLPKCRHSFHLQCIDPWLRSHTSCPVCRALIGHENDVLENGLLTREESRSRNEAETRVRREMEESREIPIMPENLRVVSDLADGRAKLGREFHGGRTRRAMSLDFSSHFMINEMADGPDLGKRACKNLSGRLLRKGPVSMKRAFSFNGKGSVRKNNGRSPEWIESNME